MHKLAPGDGAFIRLINVSINWSLMSSCFPHDQLVLLTFSLSRRTPDSCVHSVPTKKASLLFSLLPCLCLGCIFRFLNVPGAVAISMGLMDVQAGVMTKKDNWHGEEFKWTDTNLFTKAGSILRLWIMKSRRTCLFNSISPTRPERWVEAASALL